MRQKKQINLAVIDCETDPFLFNRVPKPFCVEFLSQDGICESFWGDDCIEQCVNFLEKLDKPYLIFAHNGGKFDFHFFAKYIDNPLQIINSRIVKCKLFQHELQDSYAIIPIPLHGYKKEVFDYRLLENDKREKNKQKILNYLHTDCVYLLELVSAFVERFGVRLTVGQTAMRELKKLHEFERLSPEDDAFFREFYYGGRVQCFQGGVMQGPWQIYDVNSMYPKAMRDFDHPVDGAFYVTDELPDDGSFYFVEFEGENFGALPTRTKTGLSFDQKDGIFKACSHEVEAAMKLGLLQIDKVISCHVAVETQRYESFVDTFYKQKVDAKLSGDHVGEIFAKLMLNSAYGKFGTNPANFKDFKIVHSPDDELEMREDGWSLENDYDDFEIWSKTSIIRDQSFYDVSIAASITSAARSILLKGIHQAKDVIYCDTDSLICKSFSGEVSKTELGAWKLEAEADFAAIAGKKLYTLYNQGAKKPVKLSSKGGTLSMKELIKIAKGGLVDFRNAAPTFSIRNETKFILRKFKNTVAKSA